MEQKRLLRKADLQRIYNLKRKRADELFATAYAIDEPYRWWTSKEVLRETTDELMKKGRRSQHLPNERNTK